MNKQTILVVCVHNSARSQMAEAFFNQLGGERFVAESAGIEPGKLNPVVVAAMQEIGIDISQNRVKSVDEFLDAGREFDYVITVCDESQAEGCPVFPGKTTRLHWSFDDPSGFAGSLEEKLARTRLVREQIKTKIENWLQA
ncbi:MAG: arsenate reductase ArsC [Bacillota bacterium]